MSAITTHVLDTTRGRPAVGVPVLLEQRVGTGWRTIGRSVTNDDGRARDLMPSDASLSKGVYRLIFDTRSYFESLGTAAFYPEVVVVFETSADERHYHVPLLISPFGYSTYRGT
jgi:5-hydroxyisourate hydrolase